MEGTHEARTQEARRKKAADRLADRMLAALSIGCTEIEVRKRFGYEGTLEDEAVYPAVADRLAREGLAIEVRRLRQRRPMSRDLSELSRWETFDVIGVTERNGEPVEPTIPARERPGAVEVERLYPAQESLE